MNDAKLEILKSVHDGRFLNYVFEKSLGTCDECSNFYNELIKLHNEGTLNIISAFKDLKNNNRAHNFFQTRNVLEEILPKINAPILEIMECVLHLVKEAGRDMAAGWLFAPYIEFCAAEASRPKEALKIIETSTTEFVDFLAPSIIAGSRTTPDYYLKEAIRLAIHKDIEIRRRAIFSLGRIEYPQESLLPEQALGMLEISIKQETDDGIITNIVKSAFSLYKHDKLLENRINRLVEIALAQGNELTINAASEILWIDYNSISEPLLDVLLLNLHKVKPENKGTLNNIDCGLAKLLGSACPDKGIQFIESLLVANVDSISIREFDSLTTFLADNENLLNRLMTRWFLRGDRTLCESISEIVSHGHHLRNMLLTVDYNELHSPDFTQIVFIAQKAIGYLFLYPVTATSIIVSLIPLACDDKTKKILTALLFDPLLLNYPVKVKKYLEAYVENEGECDSIKIVCKDAIAYFKQYLNDIKSTGNIPELYPSQSQREAHHRNWSSKIAASQKQAEAESVFLSLVSKSVILYGRKSINYVYGIGNKANRMETPLHNHSIEMEFPRVQNIDPFGFDYMLRVFRAGKIEK